MWAFLALLARAARGPAEHSGGCLGLKEAAAAFSAPGAGRVMLGHGKSLPQMDPASPWLPLVLK